MLKKGDKVEVFWEINICDENSNTFKRNGQIGIIHSISQNGILTDVKFGNDIVTIYQSSLRQLNRKPIGYLLPVAIGNIIPKGERYVKYSLNDNLYIPRSYMNNFNAPYYTVPKEIVETWEAVYEESTTLTLGTSKIKVVISHDKIEVEDGNVIEYHDLYMLLETLQGRGSCIKGTDRNYTVTYPKGVKIGCSEFEVADIKLIIETYNKLTS